MPSSPGSVGFTRMAFRMSIGRPRPWPGYPRHIGLISASCSSHPRFRLWLSSDPASRRAPLLRRMVPVITVHRGLSPPEMHITTRHTRPGGLSYMCSPLMLKIASGPTKSVAGNVFRMSSRLRHSASTAVSNHTCKADLASGYFAAFSMRPRLLMTFKF